MEIEVKERSSNTPPKHANRTNPEKKRRLVSDLKHLSFATNLMALANQAVQDDESLPAEIKEDPCATMQQRAIAVMESLITGHSATKALQESRGLQVCRSFVDTDFCGTFKQFSSGDLLVLANAASVAVSREASKGPDESLSVGVEKHTCNQLEAGDMDCGRCCSELPEKLWKNREELMQQRGKAAPVKVVEEAKPNDSGGCREDRLFKKKYVRKKRVEHLGSTSVGPVAGTCNIIHKSSRSINVDDAQREEGLYNNGETHSKVEVVQGQGRCGGIKDKSNRDENQEITQKRSLIPDILGKRKRSQRKRKPKETKKNSGERREGKGRVCDQMGSDAGDSETEVGDDIELEEEEEEEEEDTISETNWNQAVLGSDIADEEMTVSESEGFLEEAETEEEEDVSESEGFLTLLEEAEIDDVSEASSCNWWSFKTQPRTCKGIKYVQWSNKKKRNCICMTLEDTQSNRKILLLAVEAITHQLGLLDVSMEEKSS